MPRSEAPAAALRDQLRIVIVGHVDHGKSTLVGRLLHDTDSLSEDKLAQVRAISAKRGLDLEWSFLLDALQIERDQGITVDTTQVWFRTAKRRYVIIDAPGHKEFLRNMLSGAANADDSVASSRSANSESLIVASMVRRSNTGRVGSTRRMRSRIASPGAAADPAERTAPSATAARGASGAIGSRTRMDPKRAVRRGRAGSRGIRLVIGMRSSV